MHSRRKHRALIFTSIEVEYESVRAHLRNIHEEAYKGTIYELGSFSTNKQSWDVWIAQIGAGNTSSAAQTERAIVYLHPDVILFVGIAGGLKDASIGDVVVATKVYGFETAKVQKGPFLQRPDIGASSYRMIQWAQAEARKKNWQRRIIGPTSDTIPRVFVGPTAAGDKVVASTLGPLWTFLESNYNDALAIELEGRGLLEAIHANEQIQVLVIRGISDLIHRKSELDFVHSQELAARHASAFAFEVLSKLNPLELLRSEQVWQAMSESVASQKKPIPSSIMVEIAQLLTSSLDISFSGNVLPTDWDSFFWTKLDIQLLFNNLHLPPHIPAIFYAASRFEQKHAAELRKLMQKNAPHSRLALLFLFIETTKNIKEVLDILENTLQGAYAYDIVPLVYEDFVNIVESRDPQKVFRRYILSKINLQVISPFITTGPTPDSMFFGREHELHVIKTHAHNTSYALIGGRRIGKTSILKRLRRISLQEDGIYAFYHDCSITPTQAELVKAVMLDRSWFPEPHSHQLVTFTDVIQLLPSDRPLLILLDETDKLIPIDRSASYPLLRTLRALANSGRCQFVFCGEHSLRDELMSPDSPLYNFANEMLIGRLDFYAVQELIIRPFKDMEIELINEEHIVERIWNFSSGHPNVVQRLCQHLVAKLNRERTFYISIKDIEETIMDPDFLSRDFLDTYWEQASALERLCSLIMAKDKKIHTLTAVHLALTQLDLHPTLNKVYGALERLVDLRNILSRTADGYQFVVESFPEVLSKSNRIDDLIALISEKYRYNSGVEA